MNAATAHPLSQRRRLPSFTSIPIALRPGNSYKLPPSGSGIQLPSGTGCASQPERPKAYNDSSSYILPLPSEYKTKGEIFTDMLQK